MSRTTFFFLVAGFTNLAFADACIQIVDDGERLACFDATRACATIQSSSERLACFDSAYADADSANSRVEVRDAPVEVLAKPDASAVHSSQARISDNDRKPEPAEISASPEEFAKTKQKTRGEPEDILEATIVEVTKNALKIDFLWLDNGHVWRENEDNHVRFKVGQKVRIEEGILGSFNLTTEGSKRAVKVKRVR